MRAGEYDYVIVGAGSAGCVLAARLTEDPAVSVCLVEAGPRDKSIFLRMPAALTIPIESKVYNWGYVTGPEPQLDGRTMGQARGRCLGGSSSINGMVYVRGHPRDYDGWAEAGLPDWSFGRCLPYFKKMETFEGGSDPNRGGSGPLRVSRSRAAHAFYDAFLDAGRQHGLALAADYNSRELEGLHITQATIHKGQRQSTSVAYLAPNAGRSNLTVVTGWRADALRLDGLRAVGVTLRRGTERRTITAARETILCAGTIGTPQLLMLSGIGPASHLRAIGIEPVLDLPGVGANLQDHVVAPLRFRASGARSLASRLGYLNRGLIGLQWLLTRGGLGATSFFEVGAFLKGDPGQPYANLQHEFLPFLADFQAGRVKLGDGFQYFVSQMRPKSRGWIRLRSKDPDVHPAIVFNYLADRRDLDEMLDGIELTRALGREAAWAKLGAVELEPGHTVRTRADLERWFRSAANTEHHPVGTCRMGTGADAVTDAEGRVHGLQALRIVDGSILPTIPTANVNAPIIMTAEKIADAIRGRPPRPPETLQ